MPLTIGRPAPEFELKNQHGEKVSLASFKGEKNVVQLFYPFSFTGTCTGELCAIRDDLGAFQNESEAILGISCDSVAVQRAYADKESYKFPLLSDFWPHGEVAKAYDIFSDLSYLRRVYCSLYALQIHVYFNSSDVEYSHGFHRRNYRNLSDRQSDFRGKPCGFCHFVRNSLQKWNHDDFALSAPDEA